MNNTPEYNHRTFLKREAKKICNRDCVETSKVLRRLYGRAVLNGMLVAVMTVNGSLPQSAAFIASDIRPKAVIDAIPKTINLLQDYLLPTTPQRALYKSFRFISLIK